MRALVAPVAVALVSCSSEAREPHAGKEPYDRYCALCHGADGEGYVADRANALSNPSFLRTASDALLARAIERGRSGTAMSAWGDAFGGPLDGRAVRDVVGYLRTWQKGATIDVSSVTVDGVATRGRPLYDVECATCHGAEGAGGEYPSIASPELLADASDGYLRHAVARGRPGTPMPAFEGTVARQGIDDLVVLIRSWQKPPGAPPAELPGKDLGDPVLNPAGPDPAFGPDRYVSVDDVNAELERGARMVLLDARAPADYVASHIAGAVSVPFYDAAEYVDQLPRDRFVVCYCACPHAEADAAADVLEKAGLALVRVLDEGFDAWTERAYPVRSGPRP